MGSGDDKRRECRCYSVWRNFPADPADLSFRDQELSVLSGPASGLPPQIPQKKTRLREIYQRNLREPYADLFTTASYSVKAFTTSP